MSKVLQLLSLVVLSLLIHCWAQAAIFGTDDRKEPYQVAGADELASSIALMQGGVFFTKNEALNTYDLDFPLASASGSEVGLCKDQKFADQHAGYLNCTGFLVGEDILVTAGHCMIYSHNPLPKVVIENEKTPMCEGFWWLFDHKRSQNQKEQITAVPDDRVYRCDKVLYAELFGYLLDNQGELLLPVDPELGQDFAIIQLDRKVTGRKPLKLSDAPVALMERLSTIGYPMGLPIKHTGNGKVINASLNNYIVSDLDVIGGNSGGPLFNSSKDVVGLVVRSFPGEDFVWDTKLQCHRPYTCPVLGQGDCKTNDGHPLGSHSNRIGPVIVKLKELGILQ